MRFRLDTQRLQRLRVEITGRAKRRALFAIAEDHRALIQEAFSLSGVDPETGRPGAWPPRAVTAAGRRSRKRRDDPTPRLIDTGNLINSIKYRVRGSGYEIGPDPLPYAAIHQFGGEIPITPRMRRVLLGMGFRPRRSTTRVRVPARPYIVLPDPWLDQLADTFVDVLIEEANRGA